VVTKQYCLVNASARPHENPPGGHITETAVWKSGRPHSIGAQQLDKHNNSEQHPRAATQSAATNPGRYHHRQPLTIVRLLEGGARYGTGITRSGNPDLGTRARTHTLAKSARPPVKSP
jgi:hypothetical protein